MKKLIALLLTPTLLMAMQAPKNNMPLLQQLAARSVAKLMQHKEYLAAYKQDKNNLILGHNYLF